MNTKNIENICQEWGIENYTINLDGTVDVNGDVNLFNRKLSKIPFKFGRVTGSFNCFYNQLTTLEGCPREVGDGFNCSYNQLTTLEGCPREVGGDFFCNDNELNTLLGCPKEVGGDFDCYNNQLTSLEGCTKEVVGSFDCSHNQLTTLEGCPKEVGGDFDCSSNQITIINSELEFVKIIEYFDIEYNPIYEVYKLFPDFESFKYSLDYNYFRAPNQIVKNRFEEACEEAGIKIPKKIKGYEYI